VRLILSPINPANVNVIEGVYPSKPRPSLFPGIQGDVFVGGNEALAEVTTVGEKSVRGLKRGDWVVMKVSQVGTWRGAANVREEQLLRVPCRYNATRPGAWFISAPELYTHLTPSPEPVPTTQRASVTKKTVHT
jgi:trans-2-enoyl-CoA reductase